MKFCLLLSLVFLHLFPQDTPLIWNEKMHFSWNLYKGSIPESKKNSMSVASTCYDISYSFLGDTSVCVWSHFHSDCSWVKPDFRTSDILLHEKKHFDIVEIFARKFREQISKAKFRSHHEMKIQIQKWHKKIENEMDAYQNLYDAQTDGSMNPEAQKKWNEKIENELKKYTEFKNHCISLKKQ